MICSVIPSHPALHSRHWEEVDTSGIHACIASDTKQPLQVRRFARQYPGDSQADMDTLVSVSPVGLDQAMALLTQPAL